MTRLAVIREAMLGGDLLAVQHPNPFKRTDEERYFLVGAGWRVGKRQLRVLWPSLEPTGDGLFGDSQTYRLRP